MGHAGGTSFRPVSSCLTLFAHRKMLHERNTKMCYKPGTKTAACQPASPPGGMGQPDRLCSFYICYYIGFNLMCCLCEFAEFCWGSRVCISVYRVVFLGPEIPPRLHCGVSLVWNAIVGSINSSLDCRNYKQRVWFIIGRIFGLSLISFWVSYIVGSWKLEFKNCYLTLTYFVCLKINLLKYLWLKTSKLWHDLNVFSFVVFLLKKVIL